MEICCYLQICKMLFVDFGISKTETAGEGKKPSGGDGEYDLRIRCALSAVTRRKREMVSLGGRKDTGQSGRVKIPTYLVRIVSGHWPQTEKEEGRSLPLAFPL